MHSLAELKRLNALHMDAVNYPRLHPLVRDSIRSIEEQRPLSDVRAECAHFPAFESDINHIINGARTRRYS